MVQAPTALDAVDLAWHHDSRQPDRLLGHLRRLSCRGLRPSFHTSIGNDDEKVDISFTCADIRGGGIPPDVAQLDEQGRKQALEQIETFRSGSCAGYEQGRAGTRLGLTVPHSLGLSLGLSSLLWFMLIIILAASAMGVEYGWAHYEWC